MTNCFGNYSYHNRDCKVCKVTNSCRRNLNVKIKKPKKPRFIDNKTMRMKIMGVLMFTKEPVGTTTIHNETNKWRDKISIPTLRKYLNDLYKMNYLLKIKKGNSHYWIPISNSKDLF